MPTASRQHSWRCRDYALNYKDRTLIMGILNVTPDSFSDGGEFMTLEAAVEKAAHMQNDGADIIDVGGESTRPGADPVSEAQEIARVVPVIQRLAQELSVPISVDTYKSSVAAAALDAGASIVNDISGCRFDEAMARTAASFAAGLVLMHIKGEPKNMQKNPQYENLMREICDYLQGSIEIALAGGVDPASIVIDPGIGFGKQLKDNFQILRELSLFQQLRQPILVGPSRKSFIGAILKLPPNERLEGSIAAVTAAIIHGANIVRVHDVKQIKRAVEIADAIIDKNKASSI